MVCDPAPASSQSPTIPACDLPGKVRIRFRKGGDLRFLSHHDLMRTFERMLRRAAIPFRCTQGFHPKPRLVFALSLPLGVVGVEEVVELELDHVLPADEVHAGLKAQAPPGLRILSVRAIDFRAAARVSRLCYRIALPAVDYEMVRARASELLTATHCWVERTRPEVRRIDLRQSLSDLRITAGPNGVLEIELKPTPAGTARPEEVLRLLGLDELTKAGAVLERSRLELEDESPPSPAPSDGIAKGSEGLSAGAIPVVEGIA